MGKLPYPDLAQEIRGRVKERIRLFYHMPAALTASVRVISLDSWSNFVDVKLSGLLLSLSEIGLPCQFDDALVRALTSPEWSLMILTFSLAETRSTMGLIEGY